MKQLSTSLPQFLKNAAQHQEKKQLTRCNFRTMVRYYKGLATQYLLKI